MATRNGTASVIPLFHVREGGIEIDISTAGYTDADADMYRQAKGSFVSAPEACTCPLSGTNSLVPPPPTSQPWQLGEAVAPSCLSEPIQLFPENKPSIRHYTATWYPGRDWGRPKMGHCNRIKCQISTAIKFQFMPGEEWKLRAALSSNGLLVDQMLIHLTSRQADMRFHKLLLRAAWHASYHT
ncbi:hypothetical protein IFR05_004700 [Cadophora sp. M221]|nr:hypothetical protein IFR05_004700 [Cadophora sp. M221]